MASSAEPRFYWKMGRASQLSIEPDACFIVRDASGQALAYVYFEEEPGRRAATKLLTRDMALVYATPS
jgi:hypothetical protein